MITSINEIVIDENDNFTALGKARADIQTILENSNYNVLDLNVHRLQSEKNNWQLVEIVLMQISLLVKHYISLSIFSTCYNDL